METNLSSIAHAYRALRYLFKLYDIKFDLSELNHLIPDLHECCLEQKKNGSDLDNLVFEVAALTQLGHIRSPFNKVAMLQEITHRFSKAFDALDDSVFNDELFVERITFDADFTDFSTSFFELKRGDEGDCPLLKDLLLSHPGIRDS
ncbi:hypothetical protein OAM26_04290 [Porticoccaceae bacterium]|nr:hypothetical protein [Porticoccaceae bacterium]